MKFRKYLYKLAYTYAEYCQRRFFFIYVDKYIKKHIKLKTKNLEEYSVLSRLIERKEKKFEIDRTFLKNNKTHIINYLYIENNRLYKLGKMDYTAGWAIDYHDHDILDHIMHDINSVIYTNETTSKSLKNIVYFASKLRLSFFYSEITAKAKVQEHWIERLPIYFFCVTSIYTMQVLDHIYYHEEILYLKLILYSYVYVVSIFLVILRLCQSVSADTKKCFGEIYYKSKKQLYKDIILNENIYQELNVEQIIFGESEKEKFEEIFNL